MELKSIFRVTNPDLLIFLLTSFVAFICWLVKSLIEEPLNQSKKTFHQILEKRIEILTEVKTLLTFIVYFPYKMESKEFKEQLQKLLLKDGKVGYLNKSTFESVVRISIDPKTEEKLLLSTIKEIDEDLFNHVSKIQDEVKFYRKFSNYHPIKRFIGMGMLTLQYLLSLLLITAVIVTILYYLLFSNWCIQFLIGLLTIGTIFLINKWINK